MKNFTLIILLAILAVSGINCGYRVGSLLPSDLKTVAIPMFINKTPEPELESLVTNGVIQETIADGTLELSSEENADTLLEGEIIDYRREPIRFSNDQVTRQYRLIIAVSLVFTNLKTKEILWRNSRVEGFTDFYVGSSLPESERIAQPKAIKDLAHQVVEKVVEGGW